MSTNGVAGWGDSTPTRHRSDTSGPCLACRARDDRMDALRHLARSADPLRHLASYPTISLCPFDCGTYLISGELHNCPNLNDPAAPVWPAWVDRWVQRASIVLIVFAAVYLTAHFLVAAGVACPGT